MSDEEAEEKALREMSEAALRCAHAMRLLQSAFVVFGMEVREVIDAHRSAEPTSAKEIAECAVLRARQPL